MNPKLTAEHLRKRAVIYVRQSTPVQVHRNLESQRRQYSLADQARTLGFSDVLVIDEDLGHTSSGLVERRGFERLVAEVCSGDVGAVFCIEASRLARNGRDWHHLIELCGMIGAVLVDFDGVYDPRLVNDRLLLGLKGTMSEFELTLLRQRSLEAIRQKAARGELRFQLPIGFCWNSNEKIEKDPDQRVQQAVQLVLSKITELGSARQVLLWFRQEKVLLPAIPVSERREHRVVWKLPSYHNILDMLINPIYAGAYAFGKTEVRTKVVNGRARKSEGHRKPRSEWLVLLRDHHPGYISWEQYERNQSTIAANTHMKSRMQPKAGRGGQALLTSLIRCRRCGRMLHVFYGGYGGGRDRGVRYQCVGGNINKGESRCISFGGVRVDEAVTTEVLNAIQGNAVDAALEAIEQLRNQRQEQRKTIELAIEQARYEARLASRRYEAVDPDQRLVAAELEVRWNVTLQKTRELEDKLEEFDRGNPMVAIPDKELLTSLAQDLPAVWNSPTSDSRLKQRILRILIQEIVADVDEEGNAVVLLIHWVGGRHSELRVRKNGVGKHSRCTSVDTIEVIRQMAGNYPDEQIAATLNRLRRHTGTGNAWNERRVYGARHHHKIPAFDPAQQSNEYLTLEQAAERLGVSPGSVRKMIEQKKLVATQIVVGAPWQIRVEALESETVKQSVGNIKNGIRVPQSQNTAEQYAIFSES
jgi:excisionase family DNA binding protein